MTKIVPSYMLAIGRAGMTWVVLSLCWMIVVQVGAHGGVNGVCLGSVLGLNSTIGWI